MILWWPVRPRRKTPFQRALPLYTICESNMSASLAPNKPGSLTCWLVENLQSLLVLSRDSKHPLRRQ